MFWTQSLSSTDLKGHSTISLLKNENREKRQEVLRRIHLIKQKEYYMEQGSLLKCNFSFTIFVSKKLKTFFSKRLCARHARFLKKFSTDYFQIFYVYSQHKHLWSDKAVFNIFKFIIIKLTKKEQKSRLLKIFD